MRDVEPAVGRLEGREPTQGLLPLALGGDGSAASALVRRDDDVDKSLEEVPLERVAVPPGELELLVRVEVPAGARELQTGFEVTRGAGSGRCVPWRTRS